MSTTGGGAGGDGSDLSAECERATALLPSPWHPCCQWALGAMWLPADCCPSRACFTHLAVGFGSSWVGGGGGFPLSSYSTLGQLSSHVFSPFGDVNTKKKKNRKRKT